MASAKKHSTTSNSSNYPQLITKITTPSTVTTGKRLVLKSGRVDLPDSSSTTLKIRKSAYLALLGNAIIWGAALPVAKPALSFITPNQFLLLRYLVAAPLLLPLLVLAFKKHQIPKGKLPFIIFTESITVISLILVYIGLNKTSSLEASLLLNTRPILVTLAGVLILREVEEKHEWIGLILSIIGTTIIFASPLLNGKSMGMTTQSLIGNGIIIGSNFLNMFNVLLIKRWYNGIPKLAITSIGSWVSLIIMGVIVMATSGFPSTSQLVQPSVLTAVLYMGIPGTILAFSLLNYGYSAIESSEASLFSYLQPLVFVPLAIFWLKEPFDPIQFLGLFIILSGVILAEYRPGKQGIFAKTQKLQRHHR